MARRHGAGRNVHPVTADFVPIRMVAQRNDSDCAIAALAMLTGLPYEDVLMTAARHAPCESGMFLTQIQRVADEMGVALAIRKKGRYDLDEARGILHVSRKGEYHVCVLDRGRILDTDNSVWDADTYLATKRYRAGALLVIE